MAPDFVVIGHLTRDEHADGSATLGGAATFAAIVARELGYRVAVLTSAADDFPQPELLHDIDVVRVPSPTTTTFRNSYTGGKRQQHVSNVAAPLSAVHLPEEWRNAKIALLGPLAGEMDIDFVHAFSAETLIGVGPQGWMRQWDESGRVKPRAWQEAPEILPHANVLLMSEEDLGGYAERLFAYVSLAPLVVLTRGPKGCIIYQGSARPIDVPALPAEPIDPTGAGDTFGTAFLIRLSETGDPLTAARFGCAAAAIAIETKGADTRLSRAQVQARAAGYSTL